MLEGLQIPGDIMDAKVGGFPYSSTRFRRLASRRRLVACVQALDFLIITLVGSTCFQAFLQNTITGGAVLMTTVVLLVATVSCCVFQSFGLYEFVMLTRGREAVTRAFFAGTIASSPFFVPFLLEPNLENGAATLAFCLFAGAFTSIVMLRLPVAWLAKALQRRGVVARRIYIIADNRESAALLISDLERSPENRISGRWVLPNDGSSAEAAIEGALGFLRFNPVDLVILKLPSTQTGHLVDLARILRGQPYKVLLAPGLDDSEKFVLGDHSRYASRSEIPGKMLLVELSDRPLAGWRWMVKDVQDRALSAVLLLLAAPVLVAIAIAIKLCDRGPVLFRQKRLGYRSRTFEILKFRSMRVATEGYQQPALKLATRDDPRVTPVGRLLRKTSLDELPQLINVLRGDMWLVGPRPHSPLATAEGKIYGKAVRDYAARYRIKPGITGWAQVCGWRGPTETLEQLSNRVEHDLYYIENWSPTLDFHILFKTLFCAFGHENAY